MTVFFIITWVAFALWAAKIGYQKGHFLAGVILGGTLPYVGVIALALFPKSETHSHVLPTARDMADKVGQRRAERRSERILAHHHGKHAA